MKNLTKLTLVAIMAISLNASDFSKLSDYELKMAISSLEAKDVNSFKAEVGKRLDNMLVKDARLYCDLIRENFRKKMLNLSIKEAREFKKEANLGQKGFKICGNFLNKGGKKGMKQQRNSSSKQCQSFKECPKRDIS